MSVDLGVGAYVEIKEAGRGYVRFAGSTSFASGKWVGIELDEPRGKNDGAVKDERYFTCQPLHGMFIRPSQVKLIRPPPVTVCSSCMLGAHNSESNFRIRVLNHQFPDEVQRVRNELLRNLRCLEPQRHALIQHQLGLLAQPVLESLRLQTHLRHLPLVMLIPHQFQRVWGPLPLPSVDHLLLHRYLSLLQGIPWQCLLLRYLAPHMALETYLPLRRRVLQDSVDLLGILQ